MSGKDYRVFATWFKGLRNELDLDGETVEFLVSSFADLLASDNARFDRSVFVSATR